MFSNNKLAKLDVLESKLNIYESLSREMLDKLENAVDKISESNQRIANILTKHDERIDQSIKTDALIIKMIDEVKESNTKEHKEVTNRIANVEKTVDDLLKFRWQAAALATAAVLLAGLISPHIDKFFHPRYDGGSQPTRLK
jgi:FtsZ-binding cell division protein ZapB